MRLRPQLYIGNGLAAALAACPLLVLLSPAKGGGRAAELPRRVPHGTQLWGTPSG